MSVVMLLFFSCGGRIRTYDLWVMSPTSYHCSTPRYLFLLCKGTITFLNNQIGGCLLAKDDLL